jgi:chromosome segregation ATPase
MRESHSALPVREFAREDPDPVPADPALVARLQQAAKLANENCDRAMALAHKLSAQLREAESRINQLKLDGDRLGETETALAKLQSHVARIKQEADERIANVEVDAKNRVGHLQDELVQARDQVIEVDARIEQIKIEADERVARAEIEADARIEQIKIETDNRVARAEAEAKQYLNRGRVEIEDDFSRLKADLAQAELRADCAEKWLVLIRREIEDHLMPSFAAMHSPR